MTSSKSSESITFITLYSQLILNIHSITLTALLQDIHYVNRHPLLTHFYKKRLITIIIFQKKAVHILPKTKQIRCMLLKTFPEDDINFLTCS